MKRSEKRKRGRPRVKVCGNCSYFNPLISKANKGYGRCGCAGYLLTKKMSQDDSCSKFKKIIVEMPSGPKVLTRMVKVKKAKSGLKEQPAEHQTANHMLDEIFSRIRQRTATGKFYETRAVELRGSSRVYNSAIDTIGVRREPNGEVAVILVATNSSRITQRADQFIKEVEQSLYQ